MSQTSGSRAAPDTATVPDTGGDPAPTTEWHRLHPRMLVVHPLHDLVKVAPPVLLYLLVGRGDRVGLIISCAAIGLVLLRGLARWLLTTYRIDADQVLLRTGLIARTQRSVRTDRVRTVETTAKFGHRLFGLAVLRLGTGQQGTSGGDELRLDAITAAEADRLRRLLLRRAHQSPPADTDDTSRPAEQTRARAALLARFRWSWLCYAPLTLTGLTTFAVLVGVFMRAVNDLQVDPSAVGPIRWVIDTAARHTLAADLLLALAALLVIDVVGGLAGYVVQFANYRLTREPDATLRVHRGLFTTRSMTLEEAKLRGVRVREPALLRLGRGARGEVIATGMSKKNLTPLLVPPAPRRAVTAIAAAALRVDTSPTSTRLRTHPPAALRRRLTRALPFAVVPVAGLAIAAAAGVMPGWPWQAALVLVPVTAWLAVARYRALGHALSGPYLVTRSGAAIRETTALQRTGIIGWTLRQSVFQRRARVATLTATSAAGAGAYHVIDLDAAEAAEFAEAALPGLVAPFLVPPSSEDSVAGLSSRG